MPQTTDSSLTEPQEASETTAAQAAKGKAKRGPDKEVKKEAAPEQAPEQIDAADEAAAGVEEEAAEPTEEAEEQPERRTKETKDFKDVKENLKEDIKDSKDIIAENLKHFMKQTQVTATEVCNDLKISVSTFSDWLNKKTFPRIEKIDSLADYFGVRKSDLIEIHLDEDGKPIPIETIRRQAAQKAAAEEAVKPEVKIVSGVERDADAQKMAEQIAGSYEQYLRQKAEPDQERVLSAAYQLLQVQPQLEIPLDLRYLQYDRQIHFDSYAGYQRGTGIKIDQKLFPRTFSTWIAAHDAYLLLYNDSLKEAERNWQLAQELAHIYLGHLELPQLSEQRQQECRLFAVELVAPAPAVAALMGQGIALEQGALKEYLRLCPDAAEARCESWRQALPAAQKSLCYQQLLAQYQTLVPQILKKRR